MLPLRSDSASKSRPLAAASGTCLQIEGRLLPDVLFSRLVVQPPPLSPTPPDIVAGGVDGLDRLFTLAEPVE